MYHIGVCLYIHTHQNECPALVQDYFFHKNDARGQ